MKAGLQRAERNWAGEEDHMQGSILAALNIVKKYIEDADESKAHLIFINRHGEIDIVCEENVNDEVFVRLAEEARAQSGGPYFEVLSILADGTLFVNSDFHSSAISDEELQSAMLEADSE